MTAARARLAALSADDAKAVGKELAAVRAELAKNAPRGLGALIKDHPDLFPQGKP